MAYFGCGRKALLYNGFSEVERRGQIHPTRLSFMPSPSSPFAIPVSPHVILVSHSVIPSPLSVIPAQAGTHPSKKKSLSLLIPKYFPKKEGLLTTNAVYR